MRSKKICDFIIILLECFLILMFFGLVLPKFLDCIFYNFINKPNVYDNSILVHNLVYKNMNIINKYIDVFKRFLELW